MNSPKFNKEELENSNRIFKSATPKYTYDWYIKWGSSILLLCAMATRSSPDLAIWDQVLSLIGCAGWLVVGNIWKDRALIILNTAAVIILGSGLISVITNSI
tara:strand:+ start:398 stop:703 length:306 start_codon:yes stop_codon:yes gene_type:complete